MRTSATWLRVCCWLLLAAAAAACSDRTASGTHASDIISDILSTAIAQDALSTDLGSGADVASPDSTESDATSDVTTVCPGSAGCICAIDNDCDDGSQCTIDACIGAVCAIAVNSFCTDGNACTVGDHCDGTTCKAGLPVECDDKNPCSIESCNSNTGVCVWQYLKDGTPCDDNNLCTLDTKCIFQICQGGPEVECDDGVSCTFDVCNEKTGTCEVVAVPNCGKACLSDADCQDGDPCSVKMCSAGTCAYKLQNGFACDDGNPCTDLDSCMDGVCHSGTPTPCADANPCTLDSCDGPTGKCQFVAQPGCGK